MMLMLMEVALHDKKSHVAHHINHLGIRNSMMSFTMPLASHDQNGHVVPHFSHLDLRNLLVSFMMPSASCAADAEANGVT